MKRETKEAYGMFAIMAVLALALVLALQFRPLKADDWKYEYNPEPFFNKLNNGAFSSAGQFGQMQTMSSSSYSAESIGLSAGGAKDISNFRENIRNSYLPLPTDMTYEGLFYDYYFDTGEKEECEKLFCPSYSYAISKDPFSGIDDYYLAVGLNSGIRQSDFQRKKLNLVIVLDISGSMGSSFDRYYYDRFGRAVNIEDAKEEDVQKTKMDVAAESVVALLGHLTDEDRFGMVVFDDQAYLAKPLRKVGETDMDEIKKHILELSPQGGTQMSAGMEKGSELFEDFENMEEYENRIIFITDAMPNLGETGEEGLLGMAKRNADDKIYATFIGVGVDFNTELVEAITKTRGANYYSVHSASQFRQRMDEEFEYMVTPLVFNLTLGLDAEGYKIEKVYGSPEASEATGEIMKVNTLFPSQKEEGAARGGIILLKLRKVSEDGSLKLKVSYEDRDGNIETGEAEIELDNKEGEFFENNGIRKAILLSRYADLMKNWIIDERRSLKDGAAIKPSVNEEDGITAPPGFPEEIKAKLGRWERQSAALHVSQPYKELFTGFSAHFEEEMENIGDDALRREADVLKNLSG